VSPAPVDPEGPDGFVPGQPANANAVDARFDALYGALNKAVVGLDAASFQDGSIGTAALADGAVTAAKLDGAGVVPNGAITVAKLDAVVDSYYKTIREGVGRTNGAPSATTLGFIGPSDPALGDFGLSGPTGQFGSTSAFYLDASHYPSGTRSPKCRIAATAGVNPTAPGRTYTYGLYPVTFAGAASNGWVTLGAVVAGSTAAIASPGANAGSHAESSDFAFPAAGFYALGMALSGAEAVNSFVAHRCALQFRAT
jgi:hypothetical protein